MRLPETELAAQMAPPVEYIFKHALTQEVSYQSLLMTQRRELHRRAGEALEELCSHRLDERAAVLGYHFAEAELPEKAVVYLRRAGDRAADGYANYEALEYYRQALEQMALAGAGGAKFADQAAELHERSGDLLELIGQHDAARKEYANADAADPTRAACLRARLLRKKAKTYETERKYDAAFGDYRLAERMLGAPESFAHAEWEEWIDIGLERLFSYYFTNRVEDMQRQVDALRKPVNRRGTSRQQATFAERIFLMRFRRERALASDETVALAWRSLEFWQAAAGDLLQIGHAHFRIGLAYVSRGEAAPAEAQLRAAEAICHRTGDIILLSRSLTYLVLAARWKKDVIAARTEADRLMKIASQHEMPDYMGMVRATRAWIAYREGDLSLAQR